MVMYKKILPCLVHGEHQWQDPITKLYEYNYEETPGFATFICSRCGIKVKVNKGYGTPSTPFAKEYNEVVQGSQDHEKVT